MAEWSADDDKKMMQMHGRGYSIDEIASQIGRSFDSVRLRLYGKGVRFSKENMAWGSPLGGRAMVEGESWVRAKIILGDRLTVRDGGYHVDGRRVTIFEMWRITGLPDNDKRWI